ncbi:hypothetical protein PVAP13_3NG048386 [Panicum virgatum]|uniref:Uncharacterized protein n=1 Tax=Panicum virgatum TaxID=38727 RepID=A0A8T0U6G1_PANVG|nr:hypothetical protein PVAP13_3NG048386 [Panicum virgatum]
MAAAVVNAPAGGRCCTVAARSSAWQQLPPSMRAPRSRAAGGRLVAVAAVADVAAEGNTYLGAGFIRKAGSTLRANAARKDQAQIVCPNCNGLGKLGQIDKQ